VYWAGPTGGYTAVTLALTASSPSALDWLQVQYYNQGPSCYTSFDGIFSASASDCWAPGTALPEIAAYGIPLYSVVVGKPVSVLG
jgi:hypothetical protein